MNKMVILYRANGTVKVGLAVPDGGKVRPLLDEPESKSFHGQLVRALRRALRAHSDLFADCGRCDSYGCAAVVDADFRGVWAWVGFPTSHGEWDLCDPSSPRATAADFTTRALVVAARILFRTHQDYFRDLAPEMDV